MRVLAQLSLICCALFVSVPIASSRPISEQQFVANGEGDSVFVTTREEGVLRTRAGSEVIRLPGGIRLRALDYDRYAWNGRWFVQYEDRLLYVRDTDVVSSEADKRQAQSYALKREKSRVAAFRELRTTLLENHYWISSPLANVRDVPTRDGAAVEQLWQDDDVYVLERQGDWCKVAYDGPISESLPETVYRTVEEYRKSFRLGWIHSSLISRKKPLEREIERDIAAANERRRAFVNGHPDLATAVRAEILAGHVVIGMSKEMVRASLGEPIDVNRSVGSWGTHEQWVYDALYVYVENGIVTSWQDHAAR